MEESVIHGISLFTDEDIHLFKEGTHTRLYDKLGSHILVDQQISGTLFSVWAPNASFVSVIGDFNDWDPQSHPLEIRWDESGIWEGFVPNIGNGTLYKYYIVSKDGSFAIDKGDPFGFFWEVPPKTASVVWDLMYEWDEGDWPERRAKNNALNAPISVYELHHASWRRVPEENNRPLTYLELAKQLPEYIHEMGYTHVEFLPTMEHPFFGSWGYQKVGYYAPSSRYGTPQDFMKLIEALHRAGIGVYLDWVPSHFPSDGHGLAYFDGTHLFEHEDPKKGFHPDWTSYIFNYGRHEVKAFLISSAHFWLEKYHVDGLRVDGVASMLYLDYSRPEGEWIPNIHGGNENLEAVTFLKELNQTIYTQYPYAQMIAEESTSWPMVSRPTYLGGLGFGMKWNMGWMHDTLQYLQKDPIHRKYHHNALLFSMQYAYSENFLLSLSHDEVVHEKGSLINKMPGDPWQKGANLRLLYGYMYAHPGKKLLFMGGEFGQEAEWHHEASLDWHLLQDPAHLGIQNWVKDLNHLYRSEPALYQLDYSPDGFQWVDLHDWESSIISFIRQGIDPDQTLLAIFNFTPHPREQYRVGVPTAGLWIELLNSDGSRYGGSNQGNLGETQSEPIESHDFKDSLTLTVPPLSALFFKKKQ